MKIKNGFVVSEVIFFGFSFQADKWRAARSSCALQRCLIPFAYPDFNHASTIAQRYVTKKYIYLDDYVYEAAFMGISGMVNHSWYTEYSKITFLPYLQKVALNRSFCCGLTGLSVVPCLLTLSVSLFSKDTRAEQKPLSTFTEGKVSFVWPSSLCLDGQLNTSSWTECLRVKDFNLVWISEFKLQQSYIIGGHIGRW